MEKRVIKSYTIPADLSDFLQKYAVENNRSASSVVTDLLLQLRDSEKPPVKSDSEK